MLSTPSANYAQGGVEVEVDPDTGVVELLKYVSTADVGKATHPLLCKGQDEGLAPPSRTPSAYACASYLSTPSGYGGRRGKSVRRDEYRDRWRDRSGCPRISTSLTKIS